MGEIVQIQVGRCGNRVGNKFWQTISDEHGLDETGRFVGRSADTQLDRINVYYEETSKQVYVPRAVLVGLDATTTHAMTGGGGGVGVGCTFRPEETVVTGRGCGTVGLWPRGYYAADGVPDRVLEAARSLAERCDRLQGFQVVHSLGGGTGAGLGARVVDDLGPAFPGRAVVAHCVAPDRSASAAEPYNATMCAARLADAAHCAYVLDNRSLRRDATTLPGRDGAAYSDLNRAAARVMSGATAALRFSAAARPNAGLRKSITDLVPYPAMRFLVPGFASMWSPPPQPSTRCAPTPDCLAARLLAAVAASSNGRAVVMAAAITFRCAEEAACTRSRPYDAAAQRPEDGRVVRPWRFRWSADTVKTASCDVPVRGHRAGGAVVANTTAVCNVLDRWCRGARASSATVSRAFADHGVTVDELRLARERVQTLVDHYRAVQAGSEYDVCECGGDNDGDDYYYGDDCGSDVGDDDAGRPGTADPGAGKTE